ncbi:3-dehydroquinate synthase [Sporosarcina koreensis]|uniref:3-dehydroquinate synthase n=1 Tax=Sporosarcina koreensis TaxID=334735 RepID=UPI00058C4758|nr:3-dehydroquinate synthase [Sporosarcina koreensis]
MEQITVRAGGTPYDVLIGTDVYRHLPHDCRELFAGKDKVAVFADETAAGLHLHILEEALQDTGIPYMVRLLPSGESCKSADSFLASQSFLLQNNFTRNSLLIAFGGGACGDLTGFVAATFMRGIPFVQCPTTILAHDSAVGGKTAINMPEGKNMVGAFHQPAAVLFETDLFTTLPDREIRSGMAELLKHAFISDAGWTESLLNNRQFPKLPASELEEELVKGIRVKTEIVEQDVFEGGRRKYLNFGHTLGHAVEAHLGYGTLSHGECVMIGMAYSLLLSETYGRTDRTLTDRFIRFAQDAAYPMERILEIPFEPILTYMKKDKKAEYGNLVFVVLEQLGQPFITQVPEKTAETAFAELQKRVGEGMRR